MKISCKVNKTTLATDSAILIFCSEEVLFSIKNKISKLLNPLSVLVYPLFHKYIYKILLPYCPLRSKLITDLNISKGIDNYNTVLV